MRVKISYSIDLEDISEEVVMLYDMIARQVRTLERQSNTIEDLMEQTEQESCLSIMSKMRETMGKIDARLDDLSNILDGYVAYNKQNGEANDTPERRSPVDTSGYDAVSGAEVPNGGDVEPQPESGDISE